ncbi:hypothetical protein [Streptomyces tagetis]|uniref:Lipoprotein n=1 Tax=Streptomyces tagetis TaxID=2820809 RepID=A0A941AXD6_9ACTN|nr:hypothetical protein [Streptomyces sp. RG38]MBQ0826059.1 hypothetical protein [Streptomyces sp. RG38]
MRALPVASAALLGAGVLASCAPAAGAGGGVTPFGFSVHPATVAPGGEVTLRVERDRGGCRGRATVESRVFDTVTIPRTESSAKAVVYRDARPGTSYEVTFTCDGARGTTRITIAGGGHTYPPSPTHHPKGVHAGEGGSIAGLDPARIGLGALLVAGSLGAAHRLTRRRSAGDGS